MQLGEMPHTQGNDSSAFYNRAFHNVDYFHIWLVINYN